MSQHYEPKWAAVIIRVGRRNPTKLFSDPITLYHGRAVVGVPLAAWTCFRASQNTKNNIAAAHSPASQPPLLQLSKNTAIWQFPTLTPHMFQRNPCRTEACVCRKSYDIRWKMYLRVSSYICVFVFVFEVAIWGDYKGKPQRKPSRLNGRARLAMKTMFNS